MIPNTILDCSYVVLNFWPNLSLVVLVLIEKAFLRLYLAKKIKNQNKPERLDILKMSILNLLYQKDIKF